MPDILNHLGVNETTALYVVASLEKAIIPGKK